MWYNYFALFLLFFIYISFFYGIIALCDVPRRIAAKRNHPQQEAIRVAGWVSLFTLHAIWPLLWIWASLYDEERGWGFQPVKDSEKKTSQSFESQFSQLQSRIDKLEQIISQKTYGKSEYPTPLKNPNLEGDV